MKYVPLFALMILSLAGCREDRAIVDPGPQYLPQTSPENVLRNLVASYNWRDIDGYAALLADDFQYYFDEGTREQNHHLPEFWTRSEEIERTRRLFQCSSVVRIHLAVSFGDSRPANELGREGWAYIDVLDVLLEVELARDPAESEAVTLRVDGSQVRLYLRKGKTLADTLSDTWYIVEWRDYGAREKPAGATGQAVEATTWAELKAFCQ